MFNGIVVNVVTGISARYVGCCTEKTGYPRKQDVLVSFILGL